jgi:7-cyano-7-deazaguanine reductase
MLPSLLVCGCRPPTVHGVEIHDATRARSSSRARGERPDHGGAARRGPWGHGNTDALVEFVTNELTATCPITGQPDFYELKLNYRPKASLIESKALKLYLWGFRDKGIFAEDLAATLLEDLVEACDPREMMVDLTQQVRGGLQIRTVVRHRSEQ